MTLPTACPVCGSRAHYPLAQSAAVGCINPWHREHLVHLQSEPIGTPSTKCHAACKTPVDDPPSQLAVELAFVSCSACHAVAAKSTKVAHDLVIGDGSSTTEFACTCGARGSYEDVLRHVAARSAADLSPSPRSLGFPQAVVGEITDDLAIPVDDNFGGGSTKANYLPNEPKRPALPALPEIAEPISHDVAWGAAPSFIEPEQTSAPVHPSHYVEPEAAQPERRSRSGDKQPDPAPAPPRSIAEAFQDMLRVAYQAGAASAATGETFETWYQREVLR